MDAQPNDSSSNPTFYIVLDNGVYHFTQSLSPFDPDCDKSTLTQEQLDALAWIEQTHSKGLAANASFAAVPVLQNDVKAAVQIKPGKTAPLPAPQPVP